MKIQSLQNLSCLHRLIHCGILLGAIVILQGCAVLDPPTVYRELTPAEASKHVARIAGTAKPAGRPMSRFYLEQETYTSYRGAWNCNNKFGRAEITILAMTYGAGNSVEVEQTVYGECASPNVVKLVGRYDATHVYLYRPDKPTTAIYKHQRDKGDPHRFVSLGSLKYIDEVWGLSPSLQNGDSITGQKDRYGQGMDFYETSGYYPREQDPRPEAAAEVRELQREASKSAGEGAAYYSNRTAEGNAASREAERSIGSHIQQRAAQNAATLSSIDRQTNAAVAQANRVVAAQAVQRSAASVASAPSSAARAATAIAAPAAGVSRPARGGSASDGLVLSQAQAQATQPLARTTPAQGAPTAAYANSSEERWARWVAGPKRVVDRTAPGSTEPTQEAARLSALESMEVWKKGIESTHASHTEYGRIVSVAPLFCTPTHMLANGKPSPTSSWFCRVPYRLEIPVNAAAGGGNLAR